MWFVFIPIMFFAALILASLSAGLFFVLGAGWPWLLIGLGMWMFWRDDGRHRRAHRRQAAWPTGTPHAVDPTSRQTQKPRPEKAAIRGSAPKPTGESELPGDVQVKVDQIRRKVGVLLGYADRFPPFSQDLYLVRQTASDYLPGTLSTYLAMPRETAEKPLGGSGKTAHEELSAQLDLLESKLDDIARDLERQDTDRLLANRQFLEQRFSMRDKDAVLDGRTGVTGAA